MTFLKYFKSTYKLIVVNLLLCAFVSYICFYFHLQSMFIAPNKSLTQYGVYFFVLPFLCSWLVNKNSTLPRYILSSFFVFFSLLEGILFFILWSKMTQENLVIGVLSLLIPVFISLFYMKIFKTEKHLLLVQMGWILVIFPLLSALIDMPYSYFAMTEIVSFLLFLFFGYKSRKLKAYYDAHEGDVSLLQGFFKLYNIRL